GTGRARGTPGATRWSWSGGWDGSSRAAPERCGWGSARSRPSTAAGRPPPSSRAPDCWTRAARRTARVSTGRSQARCPGCSTSSSSTPGRMSSATLNTLVLGLGLFFLGIQLIQQYLRQLSGETFRELVGRTTHSRTLAALVGVLFGAIMQSATAVTFILVSLVSSGALEMAGAMPIIVWCNVGLTSLAFITTFDIHPVVAYLVGGAGIASGTLRRPRRHA